MLACQWALSVAKKAAKHVEEARALMLVNWPSYHQIMRLQELQEILSRVSWNRIGVAQSFTWNSNGLQEAAYCLQIVIRRCASHSYQRLLRWKLRMQESVRKQGSGALQMDSGRRHFSSGA